MPVQKEDQSPLGLVLGLVPGPVTKPRSWGCGTSPRTGPRTGPGTGARALLIPGPVLDRFWLETAEPGSQDQSQDCVRACPSGTIIDSNHFQLHPTPVPSAGGWDGRQRVGGLVFIIISKWCKRISPIHSREPFRGFLLDRAAAGPSFPGRRSRLDDSGHRCGPLVRSAGRGLKVWGRCY